MPLSFELESADGEGLPTLSFANADTARCDRIRQCYVVGFTPSSFRAALYWLMPVFCLDGFVEAQFFSAALAFAFALASLAFVALAASAVSHCVPNSLHSAAWSAIGAGGVAGVAAGAIGVPDPVAGPAAWAAAEPKRATAKAALSNARFIDVSLF